MKKGCLQQYCVMLFICLGLVCAIPDQTGAAEHTPSGEYQLKAAFIYNFIKFTRWPAPKAALNNNTTNGIPLRLAVIGNNDFNGKLMALNGKLTAEHRIIFETLKEDATWDDIRSYQILFISFDNARQCLPTIMAVTGIPVLTISDTPGFAEQGGCIEFKIVNNKLRFIINRSAIERQGLKLSYKVYILALKVLGDTVEGNT